MLKTFFNSPYFRGKELVISLFLYFGGMFAIGFGAVMTINSQAGAGGYDALTFALSDHWNIPVSYAIYSISFLALITAAILRRGYPNIAAFVTSFILGQIFDFWKYLLTDVKGTSFLSSLTFLLIGICFISLGVGAYILSKLPTNPIDDFVLALTERGLSLRVAKLSFDIPCFVLAIFLGGQIGWGSVVITLSLGPIIQFWNTFLGSLLMKYSLTRS
ncbi:membrane protein [Clostridiales bacterium COT073_COT-073]|nr:membrane protein [Clostridiales bacterium COT073_COT-073]